jgi:hypothetical protein
MTTDLPPSPSASPGAVQPSWARVIGLGAAARVISLVNDIPLVAAMNIFYKGEQREFGRRLGLGIAAVTGAIASMLAFSSYYDGYDKFKETGLFKSAEKALTGMADFFNRKLTDTNITAEAEELARKAAADQPKSPS